MIAVLDNFNPKISFGRHISG